MSKYSTMLIKVRVFCLALLTFIVLFLPPSISASTTINIIDHPTSIQPNQPFEIRLSVQSQPKSQLYLKVRLGQGSTLTKALTHNSQNSPPDDWLTDNDAWSKFPQITLDQSGYWEGSLQAKASNSISAGENILIVRVNSPAEARSYDSPAKTVFVTSSSQPTSTASPTPSPTSTSTASAKLSTQFQILNPPSNILASQILTISISLLMPNQPNTHFYLKGAFKKPGTNNYFGLTKVNNNWVKNSATFNQQLPIRTNETGGWHGQIDLRVDPEDSGFGGSGEYLLKFALYLTSGSLLMWSNEHKMTITNDLATSTHSPLPTSKNSASSSPPTFSPRSLPQTFSSLPQVQGVSTFSAIQHNLPQLKSQTPTKPKPNIFLIFLSISGMISSIGIGIYQWRRRSKNI